MGVIRKKEIKFSNGDTYKASLESYTSADELVKELKSRPIINKYEDLTKKHMRLEWHGVNSYDEALELMRIGYQPTVDRLKVALKGNFKGEVKRFKFENNVHGFIPIVPLALKGVPTCMVDMRMKPMKFKVLDIYYDLGVNCGYSSEQIIRSGQKLLGTIIDLEKQGYKFNLYCIEGYCSYDNGDFLCVKVKESNRPLDIKRISFALTHTAFLRVIGFDWQGKSPAAKYRGEGRGMPLNGALSFKKAQEFIKQLFGENAIYISASEIDGKKEEHIREVLTNDCTNK